MKKKKIYRGVKFTSEKVKEGLNRWLEKGPDQKYIISGSRQVNFETEYWYYDNDEEFFADFQKDYSLAIFSKTNYEGSNEYEFRVESEQRINQTSIIIQAPSRAQIEDIFYVFDKDWEKFVLPESIEKQKVKPTIFVGHGNSSQWKELKDHLSDKHGYKIEAYETGARAGHTIRDILDEMMGKSSIAILVMTGEDVMVDGKINPRPNVIHETGLFQGKLGFGRAIMLLEEGAEEFSNIHGIQQIRYSRGNIKETFGDIIATIKREFG